MDSTAIEPSKYEAENLMEPSQITDNIPEIHPTQQKGSGLLALKKSLNMFAKSVTAGPGASLDHTKFTGHHLSAEERQSLLEKTTVSVAMERWRSEDAYLKKIGINSGLSSSSIGAMMWEWHEALVPRIEEEVKRSIKAEKMKTRNKIDAEILQLGPYLQSLPAEKISAIAILTCMNRISTESIDESGVRLHHVVLAIGESVQNETLTEKGRNKRRYINWRVSRQRNGVKKGDAPSPAMSPDKLHFGMISRMHENLEWPGSIKVSLGAMLLSHLMDIARVQVSRTDPKTEAQVQESQPVFLHAFQYWMGRRVGVVKLNSDVIEKLTRVPVSSALAKYLPMIAEPRPWTGFREGGFYDYPLPVVRISPADVQSKRYALTAAENGDMTRVFAGLDVLAKTQWKINRFVLGVMLEVWNSGEAVASIPPEHPTAQYPPEPQPSDGLKARREWVKAMREIENRRTGLKTQRCFQNFQLEVARAYLDETFYFPHNCDFRGRAYPMVPFLNHMGADNVRGLLLFAQGKELNESGLWWLKIHLANVFGYDKASFEQRVKFTDDNRSEMYDSVNNPLGGKRWWLKAEDPWQCLAVCNELKSAYDMPDPTRYVCQLPIHQDGTCNGLQHYAALGGDVAGAQQVNLEPGSRPSDIYTAVAETVKAEIADEAAQGQKLAQVLDGLVTRKVVKQTVMTNVYGVTFVGAKRQVQKQIEDILPPPTASDHQIRASVASSYIVKKIFRSLSTMFNGAHDIQYWLTESARRIAQSVSPEQVTHVEKTVKGEKAPSQFKGKRLKGAKNELTAFKSSVIWTTPLKMPVVQPYRQRIGRRIETRLQGLSIANRSPADPVLKAKQIQAFPPNFIHSLDATHMFLTALKCHEVGLTFAAIHDSFWTHAGDVNTMNRIIRDAFIRMHSEDIIGRLAAEFKVRYKGYMHLEHVISHSPIGNRLMKWRRQYYAETTRKTEEMRRCDELALETRRLRLLSSDDPTEREEGKRMVTPGSMFAEADEKARAPLEVRPATIGGMGAQSSRSKKLIANEQLEVGDLGNTETVEPILDDGAESLEADTATIDEELESAAEDMPELSGGEESGETQLWRRKKVKCRVRDRKLWLWVPLTFPPVPKKVSTCLVPIILPPPGSGQSSIEIRKSRSLIWLPRVNSTSRG